MKHVVRIVMLSLVVNGLIATALFAQSAAAIDKSYMGTWKLNVAKSKYEGSNPPREGTRIHEDRGNGFVLVIQDGVNSQGQKTHSEYVYKADGKDYPMAAPGQTSVQRIALKAVDPLTVTYQIKADGKVVTDGKRVVAKDGQTMTLENTGTNAQGQRVHSIAFYEKQGARSTTQQ
ncbi:MAG TPA: hypothetical protein VM032_13610 [Vicinamibacterales bacterium]|nr:hypothetical protein [Vicinamibacterales bacterium]